MKLIKLKGITQKQSKALKLCMVESRLAVDKAAALEALMKRVSTVEPEMKSLGRGLAVPKLGSIDLICVDGTGRLVTVHVSERLGPEELGSALLRSEWAGDHIDLLQHIYSRRFASDGMRIWHVAREVSLEAEALILRMGEQAPEIFTCEGINLDGELWLVVRRFGQEIEEGEEQAPEPQPVSPKPAAAVPLGIRSVLSGEEIDEFFKATGDGEEITSGGSVFRDL